MDGRVVGAAESMCTRSEKEWGPNPSRGKPRDEFALRSMAQTRAIGRALRAPLGQIVVLAGYEPAGAEEMPPAAVVDAPPPEPVALASKPMKDHLDVLVGKLRDEGKHITTQHLYQAVAQSRGIPTAVLILEVGGIDEDQVLRWRYLREVLTREEARELRDRLELKQQQVRSESPFQPPPGVQVPFTEGD